MDRHVAAGPRVGSRFGGGQGFTTSLTFVMAAARAAHGDPHNAIETAIRVKSGHADASTAIDAR
jgi:hypothetical protein